VQHLEVQRRDADQQQPPGSTRQVAPGTPTHWHLLAVEESMSQAPGQSSECRNGRIPDNACQTTARCRGVDTALGSPSRPCRVGSSGLRGERFRLTPETADLMDWKFERMAELADRRNRPSRWHTGAERRDGDRTPAGAPGCSRLPVA